jgi:hypothetical protein
VPIIRNDYCSDSVFLDKGTYIIKLKGAQGGRGGNVSTADGGDNCFGSYGYKGSEIVLTLQFKKSFNLTYMLGQKGQNAPDNTGKKGSSGGGGGGGGASLVYWDCNPENIIFIEGHENNGDILTFTPDTIFNFYGIFCRGGRGGRGGWAPECSGGGYGGSGGNAFGDSGMGFMGGWRLEIYVGAKANDSFIGFATPGSPGGMGWGTKNFDKFGGLYHPVSNSNELSYANNNGYFSITREY